MPVQSVTIDVQQRDIDDGIQEDCARCPVAKAASRILRPNFRPNVSGYYLQIFNRPLVGEHEPELVYDAVLPKEVRDWIERFDLDGALSVDPISFRVHLPDRCVREQ